VRLFNPLPSRSESLNLRILSSLHDFGRINHRMHNKLFIADNSMAISGGRNMADEYFAQSRHDNFIDIDVLSVGPVVPQMSAVFDRYWIAVTSTRSALSPRVCRRRKRKPVSTIASPRMSALRSRSARTTCSATQRWRCSCMPVGWSWWRRRRMSSPTARTRSTMPKLQAKGRR